MLRGQALKFAQRTTALRSKNDAARILRFGQRWPNHKEGNYEGRMRVGVFFRQPERCCEASFRDPRVGQRARGTGLPRGILRLRSQTHSAQDDMKAGLIARGMT